MYWSDLRDQLLIRDTSIDNSDRYKKLDLLERFLKGTQYNELTTPFYKKFSSFSQYVPIRERRPSVNYNVSKIIVDRSVDMLFGDKHFPEIHVEGDEQDTADVLKVLIRESKLKNAFKKAAKMGSVGSVFVFFKFVEGRLFHEVINSKYCSPIRHPLIPDEVIEVREMRCVYGSELLPLGYQVEAHKQYVYRRDITENSEIEYFPVPLEDVYQKQETFFQRNNARSYDHNLGFVPGVWIRNLDSEDVIDGESTHEALLSLQVEIDYQISQIGKVFHVSGDPMLVISDTQIDEEAEEDLRGAVGNTLFLNTEGKADYLELSAQAQETNIKWVEKLRSLAMELGRGNRVNPENISAQQSGKSLSLSHKDIIGLVSELRCSYGDQGLLSYLRKLLVAVSKLELSYSDVKGKKINPEAHVILRWGEYFENTAEDYRALFDALKTGIEGGVISQELATRRISEQFDIEDIPKERAQIKQEKQEQLQQIAKLGQQQQVSQKMKSNLV